MKKLYSSFAIMFLVWNLGFFASAQNPGFPEKKELPMTLYGSKTFSSASGVDTIMIPVSFPTSYTLEVKATVKSVEGRGLDIEARGKDASGFRTSVDTSAVYWSNPLSAIQQMGFSYTAEQALRYAVHKDSVHVYQDGVYLFSKKREALKEITGDKETDPVGESSGINLMADWAGTESDRSGRPTEYGWENTASGYPWNTANGGSGVRYLDVTSGHTLSDGSLYKGRLMTIRWDGNDYASSVCSYPLTLAAATPYKFSFLYELWSNANSGSITVNVASDKAGTNIIASKTFYCSTTFNRLTEGYLDFTSEGAGTYYLLFSGTWAMYGIGDLKCVDYTYDPRIIIGKNYTSGAVDMQISSVTYDESGAYAPEANTAVQAITLDNRTVSLDNVTNKTVTVSGTSELHLSSTTPIVNSTIDLTSDDAWLYFSNLKPSVVISRWLSNVKVNGRAFNRNSDRVSIYKNGTVFIPNGVTNSKSALTVYTEVNLEGESNSYGIGYHKSLGAFDNKIRSFILRKGHMATLANNADGTGFSRVFIANDADLEVTTMPEGLEFASFIRVCEWDWISKKGWSGGDSYAVGLTNSTWFYDWDAAGETTSYNYEYVPMRHNANWQSYDIINSRTNVTHVLGFNEPEREDQGDISIATAINQWPELFKSGLRIGSPSPANSGVTWINEFMKLCDSLNYRVDFATLHCYEGGQTPAQWASRITNYYNGYGHKRPVWVTEWNNGANWTTESWPTESGPQRDANCNIIYGDNNATTTVSRPLSPENAEKQLNEIKDILAALDELNILERYAIYNWVQDARAIVLNNSLTPAGKYYASTPSALAYNSTNEYIHTWKIAPPWLKSSLSSDSKSFTLNWYDHNGETGKAYIVERRRDSEASYTVLDTLYAETDYAFGGTVRYVDSPVTRSAKYRVRAISYKDTRSIYSREVQLTVKNNTGIEEVATDDVKIALEGSQLIIDSPAQERIYIYSITGQLLLWKEKPEGIIEMNLPGTVSSVFIVKGSSSWVRKITK